MQLTFLYLSQNCSVSIFIAAFSGFFSSEVCSGCGSETICLVSVMVHQWYQKEVLGVLFYLNFRIDIYVIFNAELMVQKYVFITYPIYYGGVSLKVLPERYIYF